MRVAEQIAAAKVLVVGDLMLDRYWSGGVGRVSPEAPVPVVSVEGVEDRIGGAGNVAVNVVAFGAQAELLAPIGNDEAGQRLAELLAEAGVRAHLKPVDGYPTTTKLRVVSARQQLLRLDFEDASPLAAFSLEDALSAHLQGVEAPRVVLFSDYAKGALRAVEPLIARARAQGCMIVVDPKGSAFERYRGATLLTPNLHEFEAVVGRCQDPAALEQRARALIAKLELDALLVTQGAAGMTLVTRDGAEVVRFPTEAREVFDVTGAGDTVCAVLAAMLAGGHPLEHAVRYANKAAGVVVGKFGTATATLAETENLLKQRHDRPRGQVLTHAELAAEVAAARARGERIVFTNGCFDILHAGHVGYLREARSLGDRLMVGVNADASVRRLKGAPRPVNPLVDRMQVLAALSAVDWVVPFEEDTPENLIRAVCPDVLVKGGDYAPEQVVGADIVRARGGSVHCLAFLPGRSTSRILEKTDEIAS